VYPRFLEIQHLVVAAAAAAAVAAVHINSWELIILRPVTIPKTLAHSFVR